MKDSKRRESRTARQRRTYTAAMTLAAYLVYVSPMYVCII